jgi:hypothetical protein
LAISLSMNYLDPILAPQREAKLKYLDGDFQVLREGEFVRCAVSGDPIRVDNLRYWSVDRQEAYKSAVESLKEIQRQR